jgi:hypothetical protein
LHTGASSCDTKSEIKIDGTNDASDGLSMIARDVHSDGTAVMVKGQRSNIFQSEYKIQDKVCKLIIDGGSFANVISSDLVHALSLSMRRLTTPRYMQWINQSGTLKITHKARIEFSVGNYVDTVDCDIAPLSACHLLLVVHDSLILMLLMVVVLILIRLCTREFIMCSNRCWIVLLRLRFLLL